MKKFLKKEAYSSGWKTHEGALAFRVKDPPVIMNDELKVQRVMCSALCREQTAHAEHRLLRKGDFFLCIKNQILKLPNFQRFSYHFAPDDFNSSFCCGESEVRCLSARLQMQTERFLCSVPGRATCLRQHSSVLSRPPLFIPADASRSALSKGADSGLWEEGEYRCVEGGMIAFLPL